MTDAKLKIAGLLARPQVQVMIVIALAALVYSNTLSVPFVFDDESSIVANNVIQKLSNYFTNGSGYSDRPNRYIGYLSFALNYHFGGLNVVGYHVVNLFIHIANSLLAFALVRLTLKTPFCSGEAGPRGLPYLPFVVALLFAIHPIQTQAVTYVVQRLTSLATLFYLASLVLHARWRLSYQDGRLFSSRSVLPFWIMSLLSAVLAMKTKEIAFTIPFVVVLYELSFFGRPGRKLSIFLTPILLTVAIIPLCMLNSAEHGADLTSRMDAAMMASSPLSRGEYLLTQFSVILTYLRLLVLPVNQNLDYDYPVNHSLFEPRALCSLLVLLAILASALYLFWRSSRSRQDVAPAIEAKGPAISRIDSPLLPVLVSRIAAFGIFWFFICLMVESSVIPIRDVIFEHRLYLPSFGFFLACAAMATAAVERLKVQAPVLPKVTAAIAGGLVLLLSVATYARNGLWQDPVVLWQDVKAKSPMKTRAYNVLGTYYAEKGRVSDAIREFELSLRLDPTAPDVISILADSYATAGLQREAQAAYRMLAVVTARNQAATGQR